MLFTKKSKLSNSEVHLVKNFLNVLIGKSMACCREAARQKGFVLLDSWEDKLGFAKESEEKYLILTLLFEDCRCTSFQVIIKGAGQKWSESQILDYEAINRTDILKEGSEY